MVAIPYGTPASRESTAFAVNVLARRFRMEACTLYLKCSRLNFGTLRHRINCFVWTLRLECDTAIGHPDASGFLIQERFLIETVAACDVGARKTVLHEDAAGDVAA